MTGTVLGISDHLRDQLRELSKLHDDGPNDTNDTNDLTVMSIYDRLRELSKLPEDWDGLGAKQPKPEVIDSILALVSLRGGPSRIVASPSGSIVLEWQAPGIRLEVEVTEPYHAECTWK